MRSSAFYQVLPILFCVIFAGLLLVWPTASRAITPDEQDLAFNSYNNAFYSVNGQGNGFYLKDTKRGLPDRTYFWKIAEEIEMVEDAYDRTHNAIYKGMIGELYNGLVSFSGTDWLSWNHYYDDIMWACIACARAYQITGDGKYLSQAEWQFNKAWTAAWDATNGGFIQTSDDPGKKDAAVNGPAVIAAAYLAQADANTNYRNQAQTIYNWYIQNMFTPGTGEVVEYLQKQSNGTWQKVYGPLTYNQGTCIGATLAVYNLNPTGAALATATGAASFARYHLTGEHVAGILNDEYNSGNGDTPGMKGIFARWCGLWAKQTNNQSYMGWLQQNADAAWQYRNSQGVTGSQWWHRTSDTFVTSWECSSGSSMIQNVLPTVSVSGVLKFESLVPTAPSQAVTFTFRAAGGADVVRTVNVGPDGAYTITGLPPANYTVHIKGIRSLAVNVAANATRTNLTGVNATLLPADANNDNSVDIGDFGILVNAYGGSANVSGSGYDVRADFNGDGLVDIADFGLLINTYGSSGAL